MKLVRDRKTCWQNKKLALNLGGNSKDEPRKKAGEGKKENQGWGQAKKKREAGKTKEKPRMDRFISRQTQKAWKQKGA